MHVARHAPRSQGRGGVGKRPWERGAALRTRLRPCEFYTGTRLVTRECSKRKMSAISTLNPKAEVARAAAALHVNITAARGLQDVLKTNLGPKGTMKM